MKITKSPTAIAALLVAVCRAGIALGLIGAGSAFADYRETVPVLRIGMAENHVAAANPLKLEAVRYAFSNALGIPVEIIKMRSYAALVDAHASGRVGYAIHSARSFAATNAACGCVRAFRTPVAGDGSTGFRSVLVVREGVTKPTAELRVAYSNEASVSGWEIPRQAIRSGSIEMPKLVRAGSVAAIVSLFLSGEIDGFFGWLPDIPGSPGTDLERLFGGWGQQTLQSAAPLRVLWSSQRIPYGPHAAHRSLPDDLVDSLGAFLDQMPASAPGLLDILEPVFAGGYVIPDPQDYDNLRGLMVETAPGGDG
jgi:phosphonate transport system substrate-binding protein